MCLFIINNVDSVFYYLQIDELTEFKIKTSFMSSLFHVVVSSVNV